VHSWASSRSWAFMMNTWGGLQLEEACGAWGGFHLWDWIIFHNHGYSSSLMLLKKSSKRPWRISETRASFQGLHRLLSEERNQEWKSRGEPGLKTQTGMFFKIYESNKKIPWSFIGTYVWMLTLFMQWPSQTDIRLKLTENEMKVASSWQHLLVSCCI